MIRSKVTRSGGFVRSTTAIYHPFIQYQASRYSGGSNPSIISTSSSDSSARLIRCPFKLASMARSNLRMSVWSLAGSQRAENFSLTSLHMVFNIHAFFCASLALGFGTALCSSAKSPSSLVRGFRGQRDSHLRLPR